MLLIFCKMLTIAALLFLGVLAYRLKIVSQTGSREVSTLVLQICCPVMIVYSALEDESVFTLRELWLTLLVCTVLYVVILVAGLVLPRLLRTAPDQYPFYTMLSLFGNVGFIGIPVGLSILGSGSMLYIVVFNLVYNLFFYTYGLLTMSRAVGQKIPFQPSSVINTGTIAGLLALAIYLARGLWSFTPPQMLMDGLDYVSSATTFLAMLVLGVNLATTPLKKVLGDGRMYAFVVLRFLLLPCLLALVMRTLFPGDPMLVSALALMVAMPAGNMPVMLASDYGAETDTLTSGIITSTLLCVFIIPVVSLFFPT